MVNFTVNENERELIKKIVARFVEATEWEGEQLQLIMSVTACHANGCKLDLARMADCERTFDLVHDVSGIHFAISRYTGKIEGDFIPRFASSEG